MFFLPKSNVGRASFWYFSGSCESFPCHKLFHAKTTAITVGPSTIWFNTICKYIKVSYTNWNAEYEKWKFKGSTPSVLGSPPFAWAKHNQDTGTMHKNQGHRKETHRKSSAEHGSSHGLKEGSTLHPKGKSLVKDETLNGHMHHLDARRT